MRKNTLKFKPKDVVCYLLGSLLVIALLSLFKVNKKIVRLSEDAKYFAEKESLYRNEDNLCGSEVRLDTLLGSFNAVCWPGRKE